MTTLRHRRAVLGVATATLLAVVAAHVAPSIGQARPRRPARHVPLLSAEERLANAHPGLIQNKKDAAPLIEAGAEPAVALFFTSEVLGWIEPCG